jgi:heme-degrading monooxygenase HmoA
VIYRRQSQVVLFEVYSKSPDAEAQYLKLPAELRSLLDKIDRFISVERFRGVTSEGKILSLSFWRDSKPWPSGVKYMNIDVLRRKAPSNFFLNRRCLESACLSPDALRRKTISFLNTDEPES